jgi:hypothetical protein
MRKFTVLMLLSLVLTSCQSSPTDVISTDVPQAALTQTPSGCEIGGYTNVWDYRSISQWTLDGQLRVTCDATQVRVYATEIAGSYTDANDEVVLIPGRIVLIGVDNHPGQGWFHVVAAAHINPNDFTWDHSGYTKIIVEVKFADGGRDSAEIHVDSEDVVGPPDDFPGPPRTRGRGHISK